MCDLTITRLDDERFWVVTGGGVGKHDLAWMRKHLPDDGSVALHDRTSGLCCVGVWGPLARSLVQSVSEDDLSNEAFPYMTAASSTSATCRSAALRISYVGELGWEIYAPTEFGAELWDTLWRAGEPLGAVACGGGAYDSLRLEKGYRLWGQDIDEEHNAYEAGLGWLVRLGKGDFIGREAAARIKEEGVDAAAVLPGHRRPARRARRQGGAARRRPPGRLRDERRLRRDRRREHPVRVPAAVAAPRSARR